MVLARQALAAPGVVPLLLAAEAVAVGQAEVVVHQAVVAGAVVTAVVAVLVVTRRYV